ncbi:hypothetical protein [Raineya orbicola]|uniref:Uncharacterized protein n=1 Tax=Raineya orbicola TaxID=2016530 RepID=A0A2N3IHU6_9BACT|nr:hypothetical protein [Raineya orbicola]PKQ69828.1 hypothetical protein Rain11_1163 [Raineya orbicola]
MNQELAKALKLYATRSHQEFSHYLLGNSKDTLIALFADLLTMYINDKNSSSIREFLTVTIAGFEHSEGKIGFNGFKQNSIIGGKPIYCEAKPQNIHSTDFHKQKNKKKLNGGGNFTDYTWARFEKDKKENPYLLTSGFVDGKLLYILSFPFQTPTFLLFLEEQLQKHFPNGDEKNKYLRSCRFNYKNYLQDKSCRVIYLAENEVLEHFKAFFDRKFYTQLIEK